MIIALGLSSISCLVYVMVGGTHLRHVYEDSVDKAFITGLLMVCSAGAILSLPIFWAPAFEEPH